MCCESGLRCESQSCQDSPFNRSTSLITDDLFDYCLSFEALKILGLFLLIPNPERRLLQSHHKAPNKIRLAFESFAAVIYLFSLQSA